MKTTPLGLSLEEMGEMEGQYLMLYYYSSLIHNSHE